jgi:putative ABC transport system permease protein
MIRIALSNLRSASGRLVAAGIAIAVSVAFMVAALLFSQAFGDTLENQVRSSWAGTDIAVMTDDSVDPSAPDESTDVLNDDLLEDVTAVDGVADAHIEESGFLMANAGSTSVTASVTGLPPAGDEPTEGSLPQSADQVALTAEGAESLGVAVGDTITLEGVTSGSGEDSVTVSGLLPDTATMRLTLHMTEEGLEQAPAEVVPDAIRVRADDGADSAALAAAIGDALDGAPVTVLTVEEVVQEQLKDLSGSSDMLAVVGVAFGLLSVGVASLVISNTFQVLVASRARVLALYRAVGATARQLRGATLVEGLLLGLAGAVAGLALGLLLGWGLSGIARAFWMPDFARMSVTPAAVIVGPLVGIAVTVIAGMVPAFRAGGVSPIEALRPADVAPARSRFPWIRAIVGGVLGAAGLAGCLLAVALHSVLIGIVGCFALFVAVLVAARVFVPPLLGLMGRVLSRLTGRSTTVLLAGRSASSAPGRSSSTTAALLIGVTLVSAVIVGAASLQHTIEQATAQDAPVDLVVDGSGTQVEAVLDDASITQTHAVVPATRAEVTVADAPATASGADDDAEAAGDLVGDLTVTSAAEAEETVLRSDGFEVEPGTIRLAPADLGGEAATDEYAGLEAAVAVGGETFTLTVDPSRDAPSGTALVSGEDAARMVDAAGADATQQTWVRLADDASITQIDAIDSQLAAQDIVTDADPALLRAQYADVFQIAITVVLGLLAAAVVIAVIGVSNTLTLSVIDRRREGALLRALGFTRGALGRMITTESLLMTVIALIVGMGLGTFFGWVGTASLITETATPLLSVPPVPLALIAVAAVVAAVLASALPARSMSRVVPAEGMSRE